MRRAASLAVVAYVVVLAAFAVVLALPFVSKERDQPASITSPPALLNVGLVPLAAHQRACIPQLAMDAHAREARFRVGTFGKSGPRLAVAITPGTQGAEFVPAGYADNSTLTVPVDPGGAARLVRACVTNDGPSRIALYAAAQDPARSRAIASVGGRSTGASPEFGFWEAHPVSIATRAPDTIDRIATFRGFLGHAWFAWLVLGLFLAGLPLGFGWLAWRGGST